MCNTFKYNVVMDIPEEYFKNVPPEAMRAFAAFCFTERLYGHLIPDLAEDVEFGKKVIDTLKEIASGDSCLARTPSEMTRNLDPDDERK